MAQGVNNPDVISLAAGLVDAETLPTADALGVLEDILGQDDSARAALQYGTTEGVRELRQVLLEHLAGLDGLAAGDWNATADDVLITSGSQQLLFMLADVLIDEGDIVIAAWPSYFVYTGTLTAAAAQVRCVDMDDDGIRPEALEAMLEELSAAGELHRVKMVYLCTYHQNPTGITLSADRKEAVFDLVRRFSKKHRILLLEDAAYRELTCEGQPPASFKYFDRDNRYVALLQTFSKPFAPGLKTGYGLLPRDLVDPVVLQKGNHDFGSSNLCQHLLLAAMRQGIYQRHVAMLRERYAAKRDAMLAALDEHLAPLAAGRVHWTRPTGGLYVYVTLPEEIDTGPDAALFARALDEGVLYVPGEYCYAPDPTRTAPKHMLRLCYGVASIDKIRLGVERLARAIRTLTA